MKGQLIQVLARLEPYVCDDGTVSPHVAIRPRLRQRHVRGVPGKVTVEADFSTVTFVCPTCPRTVAEWYFPTEWPFQWHYKWKYKVGRDEVGNFVMTCPRCKCPHVMSGGAIFEACMNTVIGGRDRFTLAR